MRAELEAIARRAGKAILEHYPPKKSEIDLKGDGSPVTIADMKAHKLIVEGIAAYSSLPIVSEESFKPESYPPSSSSFWLVDPLDGTKDFIRGTGHFTVNIALIDEGRPIAGVIYVPVADDMYSAMDGVATKNNETITTTTIHSQVKVGVSHFHQNDALKGFMAANYWGKGIPCGSSLKFCLLAEGVLDIYPRLGPCSEWDTAAGQAIAEAAGCFVLELNSGQPLSYGKGSIINPNFIAAKPGLNWQLS